MRVLLIFITSIFLFASDEEIYLNYAHKILDYHFKLKNFDKIKPPFYEKPKKKIITQKPKKVELKKKEVKVKKIIKKKVVKKSKKVVVVKHLKKPIIIKRFTFKVVSILEDSALIEVNKYVNNQLIKSYKRWLKQNDKFENCIIDKISLDKVYFKCNNKTIVKSLIHKRLF